MDVSIYILLVLLSLSTASCHDPDARAMGRYDTVDQSPRESPAVDTSSAHPMPAGFQYGVNHAHIHRRGHGYGSEASARELDSLHLLGVNAIAITPFGFQRGATADCLAGYDSTTDSFTDFDRSMGEQSLIQESTEAHKRGMTVMLKPQLWSNDFWNGGEWHGTVRQNSPKEHACWWRSYRAFALYYANVAERGEMDYYCIGTELVQLSTAYPDEWRELANDIRKVYHGKLTYAAHWDKEFDAITFWDALDIVGVNAYFPLKLPDDASLAQLTAAWKPYADRLCRLSEQVHRPIFFTEIGYRSVAGSWREPWRHSGGIPDLESQSRAFSAVAHALSDSSWFGGIYLWKTFTDPRMTHEEEEDQTGFTFRGRPAESVVRDWYHGKGLGSTPKTQ